MHKINMKWPAPRTQSLERVKDEFHFTSSLNFSLWKKWRFMEMGKRKLLRIVAGRLTRNKDKLYG